MLKDYNKEMQELVGVTLPVTTTVDSAGRLISASYEPEWKEGGTTPVTDKKGNVVDYKEDYIVKKLTKDQVSKLDKYIQENVTVD